jgi:hypothetical protein
MSLSSWTDIVNSMMHCKACLTYSAKPLLSVRPPPPTFNPPNPNSIRPAGVHTTLFVSEALPGGRNYGNFFWNENQKDLLRSQLLRACFHASLLPAKTLRSFKRADFYLLPAVPAACERFAKWNRNPPDSLIVHSARAHLSKAIEFMKPV